MAPVMNTPDRTRDTVQVIHDAGRVAAMLPPMRRKILESLRDPGSASGLARRFGVGRQKINYHVRRLERAGLIECVEERPVRGCIERIFRLTARAFLISPQVIEGLSVDPDAIRDRFSSSYLVAAATRVARQVTELRGRAAAARRRLPTLTLEADVAFASPADLSAFAGELGDAVAALAAKYHRPGDRGSRKYRFLVGGHPAITRPAEPRSDDAKAGPDPGGVRNGRTMTRAGKKEDPRR